MVPVFVYTKIDGPVNVVNFSTLNKDDPTFNAITSTKNYSKPGSTVTKASDVKNYQP